MALSAASTDRAVTHDEKQFKRALRKRGWHVYRDEDSGRLVTNAYPREVARLSQQLGMPLEIVSPPGLLVKVAAVEQRETPAERAALARICIELEDGCSSITAREGGEVLIRRALALTDYCEDEPLDGFVARHGGALLTVEYLRQCDRSA